MLDLISVEIAISWKWRCLTEKTVIPGAALRAREGARTTSLANYRSLKVNRDGLQCACGGRVTPLSPIR